MPRHGMEWNILLPNTLSHSRTRTRLQLQWVLHTPSHGHSSVSQLASLLKNNGPLHGRVKSWACCPVFSPCM